MGLQGSGVRFPIASRQASGAIAPIIYPMEVGKFVLASDTGSWTHDSKLQVDNEAFVDGGFVANTPIMKAARFWSMEV